MVTYRQILWAISIVEKELGARYRDNVARRFSVVQVAVTLSSQFDLERFALWVGEAKLVARYRVRQRRLTD